MKAIGGGDPDDLDLLAFVGGDLPGAVTVHPDPASGTAPDSLPDRETSENESPEMDTRPLRFSLAGIQLKFSVLRKGEKLLLPAEGQNGHWIVKFPSPTFPQLPANEFAVMSWARTAGFDVPEIELGHHLNLPPRLRSLVSEDEPVLVIQRFDRTADQRIHQEDLAQAVGLPPEKKYDHVTYDLMAQLVRRFVNDDAINELIRRLMLVVASGNNDAHLKNWSLVYYDRIQAQWSPLYDQVSTVAWPEPNRKLALKWAGVEDFHRLDRKALRRFAQKIQRKESQVEDVAAACLASLAERRETVLELLPPGHDDALREHWRRVPMLSELGFPVTD